MKNRRFHAVLVSAGLLAFAAAASGEIREDIHIQSNADAVSLDVDANTYHAIKGFFEEGYPPASVMLHAISLGMPIDDVVYLAVKSDPQRAQEFYDTAYTLLPSLPGWVCRASADQGRYVNGYELGDLGTQPSIAAVAQRYFDKGQRLIPFPDWINGGGHMEATAQELASLVKDEWWYKPGQVAPTSSASMPNRPIFVSLYKDNREIVVDADLQQIQSGPASFPVVFIYNEEKYRPISRFEPDVTVNQIADEFFSNEIRLTSVPEWAVGDYHKFADIKELKEIFNPPKKNDVPPERWQEIENELKENGFSTPLLLTLFGSGSGRMWVDQVQKISVAESLGIAQAPVVFLYHNLDRYPCGREADCTDRICDAAVAGGADESVCRKTGAQPQQSGFTPPGGAGGVPPPSSAPPSPGGPR